MNRVVRAVVPWTPWLLAGLILLVTVAAVPAFRRPAYWGSLGQQYFAAAVLALALTPVVITGGIDLSVGSVTALCAVVIGALWRDLGLPIGWALAGGVLVGLLGGVGNGVLVNLGILPLVATLATRELYRGLALTVSGTNPVTRFPAELNAFWRTPWFGVPVPLLGVAGAFGLVYVLVHHTWVGRAAFALGDNEQAARFAGLPVARIKLGLYAAVGLAAGVCGAALVCQYGAAKADAERSLDLLAIACVVMGGVRITGGGGHVAGTLLGVVTVVVLLAGLSSVAAEWRDTVTGAMLVGVAVVNEAAARWVGRQVRAV